MSLLPTEPLALLLSRGITSRSTRSQARPPWYWWEGNMGLAASKEAEAEHAGHRRTAQGEEATDSDHVRGGEGEKGIES
jgi:hypothetical protein